MVIWLIPTAFYAIGMFALYDAVQWSDAHWDRAGLRRLRWLGAIGLLGAIGAALYFFRALPKLERVGSGR